MNKVDQMWYLLYIFYDFATVVIPFFRAVGGDGWCLSARDLENIHGGVWSGVSFCYGVW